MENEEVGQELDGELETTESEGMEDSQKDDDTTGEDTTPERKNKSNFKALSKKAKLLEAELAEKNREIESIKEWANSLYDETEKPFTKKEAQEEKTASETLDDVVLFYTDNPDAKEYKDDILEAMKTYKIDREKAWKFVKSDIPQESKTKREFSSQQKAPPVKKDLSKITLEETWSLTPEERAQWRKQNWWTK